MHFKWVYCMVYEKYLNKNCYLRKRKIICAGQFSAIIWLQRTTENEM